MTGLSSIEWYSDELEPSPFCLFLRNAGRVSPPNLLEFFHVGFPLHAPAENVPQASFTMWPVAGSAYQRMAALEVTGEFGVWRDHDGHAAVWSLHLGAKVIIRVLRDSPHRLMIHTRLSQ